LKKQCIVKLRECWFIYDKEVVAAIGRFGPYVRYDGNLFDKGQYDPHDIEIDEAIAAIEAKIKSDAEN